MLVEVKVELVGVVVEEQVGGPGILQGVAGQIVEGAHQGAGCRLLVHLIQSAPIAHSVHLAVVVHGQGH